MTFPLDDERLLLPFTLFGAAESSFLSAVVAVIFPPNVLLNIFFINPFFFGEDEPKPSFHDFSLLSFASSLLSTFLPLELDLVLEKDRIASLPLIAVS